MTTYRLAGGEGLEFGDICAGAFLADIRVGEDTLPVYKIPDNEKLLAFTAYAETRRPGNRLVVTRGGMLRRAVVVSDGCAIETALGRGNTPARGRIWLAPVRKLEQEGEIKEAEDTPDAYERLLLPPDNADDGHWVIELEKTFPVDAKAVRRALDENRAEFVLTALDANLADALRARWAAVSVRSGPLVAASNADHLLDRLEDQGIATTEAEDVMAKVASVAAASWVLEGDSLEEAGALREEDADKVASAVDAMIEQLAILRDASIEALDALSAARAKLPGPDARA